MRIKTCVLFTVRCQKKVRVDQFRCKQYNKNVAGYLGPNCFCKIWIVVPFALAFRIVWGRRSREKKMSRVG
jgi:hypothetical protein